MMAKYGDDLESGQASPSKGSSRRGHSDPNPKEPRCQMSQGMLRCALWATWYPNSGTRGYCWLHDDESKWLTGPELHDQLQDIREHRNRYIAEHEGTDSTRQRMRDLIEAHPEWHRGEEEGAREYALRMMAMNKGLGRMLREKQYVQVDT